MASAHTDPSHWSNSEARSESTSRLQAAAAPLYSSHSSWHAHSDRSLVQSFNSSTASPMSLTTHPSGRAVVLQREMASTMADGSDSPQAPTTCLAASNSVMQSHAGLLWMQSSRSVKADSASVTSHVEQALAMPVRQVAEGWGRHSLHTAAASPVSSSLLAHSMVPALRQDLVKLVLPVQASHTRLRRSNKLLSPSLPLSPASSSSSVLAPSH
mmetsp:Transcript_80182/g.141510  ORF Transcript_80182/g.141510 Transcript_80182/m.141510 type:complete len:213 (+) Transcript_80182:742-1380(+)